MLSSRMCAFELVVTDSQPVAVSKDADGSNTFNGVSSSDGVHGKLSSSPVEP